MRKLIGCKRLHKIMDPEVLTRFLSYVKIHTTSQKDVENVPSTEIQFNLANILVKELKELGIDDAKVDQHCIVTGTLKSNFSQKNHRSVPSICFIAHLDTSPDVSGENVKPKVVEYSGGDIVISQEENLIIKQDEIFPPVHDLDVDKRIITTDGATLLGADNKAGIAEIMTAISKISKDPNCKHGDIKILFTPDEETGNGIKEVNIDALNVDFAYTIDGGRLGEFETECFNAANGDIEIFGINLHPGYAYGKMINAIRIIPEILTLFPKEEAPETTKQRQGYYHPDEIHGNVESIKMHFLLRDFDFDKLKDKIKLIESGIEKIRMKHPQTKISSNIKIRYRNMKHILDENLNVIEIAEKSIRKAGIEIIHVPIRGGTDGAQLTFRGLPTPNIFSGGINFHSRKEFIPLYSMEKAVEVIMNIVKISAEDKL